MAPLNLSDSLGPKVDLQTGRWIPVSETYIEGISGVMTQRRLIVAQVSDTYLVRWYMDVTSAGVAGAAVTPQVLFFGYGQGAGKQLYQKGTPMAAVDTDATSSTWMLIRSASSDIYITTQSTTAGVPPTYKMYVSIGRPS